MFVAKESTENQPDDGREVGGNHRSGDACSLEQHPEGNECKTCADDTECHERGQGGD